MIVRIYRTMISGQHKAVQIFIVMSIWILVLIVGLYKFWDPLQARSPDQPPGITDSTRALDYDVKTKKILKICNLPRDMEKGNEGGITSKEWILRGVLVVIRHGDRGPLQHVRNISAIDCSVPESDLLRSYKSYLHNLTLAGRAPWIGPGPFHNFPLLPTHHRECQLGQLTMQGIEQLLHLGAILGDSYAHVWPKLSKITSQEVQVYSTRYRRTFQSALALLFGLLPHDTLSKITFIESQSMSFCFKDCGCPITERYNKLVTQAMTHDLKSHAAVISLSSLTGRSVFEDPDADRNPNSVRDALLSFICHGAKLPCDSQQCIRRQHILGIFAYTDWALHQKWKNKYWQRFCLLKSYGLIRHLVAQMLNMISNSGPYFLLYSGHDHTLEQLSSALGLEVTDPAKFQYGGRLTFEVYHHQIPFVVGQARLSQGARGLYFRVLSNGRDVTREVAFCKEFTAIAGDVTLCKIEDIVRFIHDDYFVSFNVTNYKDACYIKT